jgi:hypothetical protein
MLQQYTLQPIPRALPPSASLVHRNATSTAEHVMGSEIACLHRHHERIGSPEMLIPVRLSVFAL